MTPLDFRFTYAILFYGDNINGRLQPRKFLMNQHWFASTYDCLRDARSASIGRGRKRSQKSLTTNGHEAMRRGI